MLMKLRKAQSTAEYAMLFSLVIAAIVAVQPYIRKALSARMKDAADDFVQDTGGTTAQWHGVFSDKTTTKSTQHTEFLENYDNAEEPFEYKTDSSVEYHQVTIQ